MLDQAVLLLILLAPNTHGLLNLLQGGSSETTDVQAQTVAGVPQVTPGCDFYQNVEPGDRFYIYSPNYPRTFAPHTACRWYAVTRVGWRVELECREVQLDEGVEGDGTCDGGDVLLVSLSGDARLRDAHGYCGVGSFLSVTHSNLLNVVFEAGPRYIPGNRFMCVLQALPPAPPPTTTTPPPPSCACGNRYKNRIVGGEETGVNEFPMMAGVVDVGSARVFCGATIISPRRAVTAAHCLVQRMPANLAILVGDHDLSTVTQQNDIAVLETVQEITFNAAVGPVCLPFRYENDRFEGAEVIALGWGSTSFGGETSSKLKKVELNVVSDDSCQRAFSNVGPDQICTFKNGSDACQSDSGGPVLWQDPSTRRLHLVGIISYGVRCASDLPAVNTRITSYLDWLQQTTGDDFCISR
ncbi:hypothetical protein B566_EDAN016589 [Ephemera danica]|nr:hypothetical protein B566_EDAN016589 [Ephemera danica]